MLFSTVLIANRGAIACRIIRALKKLGIKSVVVYSEADVGSLHVSQADLAICIGPGPAAESYLCFDKIFKVAKETGAKAIHPGYGFLSENADFAEACAQHNIVFIGPTPQQMRDFGLKHTARSLAKQYNVPMLPGSELLPDFPTALSEAQRVGYPVMLKSTAGGGGIGMKMCADAESLKDAYDSVQRLAVSAFSQSGMFLEKYVSTARHIEVQIFGDGKGNVVALGERDCSTQRRNQKVVEETPAPNLSDELRKELLASAYRLASGVGYQSAGTVEFVYDEDDECFYFLEVNTRLQVEHGITEQVTGVDLVEWMIKAAALQLDLSTFESTPPTGCSIQVRIYAEDPNKNFLPSSGVLTAASFPSSDIARVETWVESGIEIPSFYDPMIAKILVSAATRASAIKQMSLALNNTHLSGIECNLEYLKQIVKSDKFAKGEIHTKYLDTGFEYLPRSVDVIVPGTSTSVQDSGRIGYWSKGVPPSGPMDDYAHRIANQLVGNVDDAAALEITLSGPTLKFNCDTSIALCGAEFEAEIDGNLIPLWSTVHVKAGSILKMCGVKFDGCRATLAILGGFDVPVYLDSRSTFALGKFGGHAGRILRHGDVLPLTSVAEPFAPLRAAPASLIPPTYTKHWNISVLYGPHAAPDFFTSASIATLFSSDYKVHYNSNRLGIRLSGPKPEFTRTDGGEAGLHPSNIHDTCYAIGTINFTGEMPVIIAKDGPSLGGFVCPVTIISAELWKIGQLCPGDTIRFVRTSLAVALEQESILDEAIAKLEPPSLLTLVSTNDSAIIHALPATLDRPQVVYRMAGDRFILIEYGPLILDLDSRFRVHSLQEWFRTNPLPGMIELSPGVRSLQVNYDGRKLPLAKLMEVLIAAEDELPLSDSLILPSRVVRLPLAFNASSSRAAIAKYQKSVRDTAPWLPSNIEFIRRINGLSSHDEVETMIYKASYLVLGLGDVYLGAPCAVPLDPRHRLQTTKYNPARTYTAEGEVGIGGVYMCVYGMDSPGGYQLVGRTTPVWNTHRVTSEFPVGQPWLLKPFDQVQFYPMPEAELNEFRRKVTLGQAKLDITEVSFSVAEYKAFLVKEATEISTFKVNQEVAFTAERARWEKDGSANYVEAESSVPQSEEEIVSPSGGALVFSPILGSVWEVNVKVGDVVKAGQKVACIEAMKMEVAVEAPIDGVVNLIAVTPGCLVSAGQALLTLSPVDEVPMSLDLQSLSAAYAKGDSVVNVIREVFVRIAKRGDDKVWISLRSEQEVIDEAAALEKRRESGETFALYGVPFAVKDNIDVAGLETTAACPAFAYKPSKDAEVVRLLRAAGAIVIGKSNLDQFATGLVGVRSPYGAPSSIFNEEYISGGSSSGSAVATAAGIVAFALGTDTAGSGRVPAAFNSIVGWKPTKGLVSTTGLVPACRSLDCVSVLSLTCSDAADIAAVVSAYDSTDIYSKKVQVPPAFPNHGFRFGVPREDQLEFFGDDEAKRLYNESVKLLVELGGLVVEVEFGLFSETADLLYSGPWVAERMAAISPFATDHSEALHPITAKVINKANEFNAVDTFRAFYKLEELKRFSASTFDTIDVMLLPTTPTIYTHAELEEEPVLLNTRLGIYTNFVNLLDLCGVAVPSGFRDDGLPLGVTLLAPAFTDAALLRLGGRMHAALGGKLGGTLTVLPALKEVVVKVEGGINLAVVGAHLMGQPLNHQLTSRGAVLVSTTRTTNDYKLYALANTEPAKPGLFKELGYEGKGIDVEVWNISVQGFGAFVAEVSSPLAIGSLKLQDGSVVKGFVCEPIGLEGAIDVTSFGGWRAFLKGA